MELWRHTIMRLTVSHVPVFSFYLTYFRILWQLPTIWARAWSLTTTIFLSTSCWPFQSQGHTLFRSEQTSLMKTRLCGKQAPPPLCQSSLMTIPSPRNLSVNQSGHHLVKCHLVLPPHPALVINKLYKLSISLYYFISISGQKEALK